MARKITKPGFDLGLVTTNSDAMLEFYRDVVGLESEGPVSLEDLGIARMDRLRCGDSLLKLVTPVEPVPPGAPDGIRGSAGMRYLTIAVEDISDVMTDCAAAGAPVVWPRRELFPGLWIAMVEDPDGNWLEFLQQP